MNPSRPMSSMVRIPGLRPAAFILPLLILPVQACRSEPRPVAEEPRYETARERMVERDIAGRGVTDDAVLAAMLSVERHEFVPDRARDYAYQDAPLSIGHGQTISQPYIVALMTEWLDVGEDSVVFEVGTGSGYQAAVLGEIVKEVYSIEIVEALGQEAIERLARLGYDNVHARVGDGYAGWPEHAPFDGIIVTCAPDHVPEPLIEQLKIGGRMCIPVGPAWGNQTLYKFVKQSDGSLKQERVLPVRFVPLTRNEKD